MSDAPATVRDPRGPYDDLLEIPAQSWAWEFLRRGDRIRGAWTALKPAWEEVEANGIRTVRLDLADSSELAPLLWASSPDQGAADASLVWDARANDRVLHAVAVPVRFGYGGTILDLEQISVQKNVLQVNGDQHLLLQEGHRSLQIAVTGAPITDTVALFVDTGEEVSNLQLSMLGCLRALRRTGTLDPWYFPPHPRAKRLLALLKALDGYLAGKRHREIAVELFGSERVERDWSDPGEHLRDAVRRAIVSGVALMEHGYQRLLR